MVAGLIQVPLLVLGIDSLLQASPLAFDLMRWCGAAYLIWLGFKLLCSAGHGSGAGAGVATSGRASAPAALCATASSTT
jgi:threonine/homoserine/homoserine lactone efflux protein